MTTFTRTTQTVDETTGIVTPTVTTIDGDAVQVRGLPSIYQALSLIESDAPTLLFTPTTYGLHAGTDEFVRPGDTVNWANTTYTAVNVNPTAPDGIVIIARIVVKR